MKLSSKIYIAGYTGLVGSAIKRLLELKGYNNLIYSDIEDFDLTRQKDVEDFFEKEQPEYVFLAAAKVGGIYVNRTYPADFIYSNICIQTNIVQASYKYKVKKLLFLGSSCIYPKHAPQPMTEDCLLTSPLEPTNEAYAIAKISGLKMCRYYNEQYGTNFISVMPTNLYGPGDNYNLETSHVLPAMIRKMYLAKCIEDKNWEELRKDLKKRPIRAIGSDFSEKNILNIFNKFGIKTGKLDEVSLALWGTGSPRREFLYVDDLGDAVIFLMENYNYDTIGEVINIGAGEDLEIKALAEIIKDKVGFKGNIDWDHSKPDGTPRKFLDSSKLKNLGWEPKVPLESGIEKTFSIYKDM